MNNERGNKMLWRYAGLSTEFLAGIGIGVFAGAKLDKWMKFSVPLFVWILPLLIIIGMTIKIIRDTSKKRE